MHSFHGTLLPASSLAHKVHANVIAEFDTESKRCDQIDDQDGVHLDRVATADHVHHPADAHQFKEGQEDTERDNAGDSQASQDLDGHDNGTDADEDVLEEDTANVGVLVIVDIVKRVGEGRRGFILVYFCLEH